MAGKKEIVEPGLAALKRFFTTLPETAAEWPRQAFDMVRMPADFVLGGSPEEKVIEARRQQQAYADFKQGRLYNGQSEATEMPAARGSQLYRPGSPEARAHQVSEFVNPIANSVFAPVKAAKGLKQGALELMNRALTPNSRIAQAGAIKPRGGNWLTEGGESIKDFVRNQRISLADHDDLFRDALGRGGTTPESVEQALRKFKATNGWLDGPFTNYLKRDFASPDDPVRALADEGITHGNTMEMFGDPAGNQYTPTDLARWADAARRDALHIQPNRADSFIPRAMAKTEAGRRWENLADTTSLPTNKQSLGIENRLANPWTDRLADDDIVHKFVGSEETDLGVQGLLKHFQDAIDEGTLTIDQLKQMSMEKAVRFAHERNQAKEAAFVAEMLETGRSPVYAGSRLQEAADGSYLTELSLPKELTEDMRKLVRQNKDGTWSALTPSGKVMKRRIRPGEESPLVDVVEDTPEKALLGGMLGHEGRTMKHCVGGYCDDVASGRTRVISMRGPDGQSHVTMDIEDGIPEDVLQQARKAEDEYSAYADGLDRREDPIDFPDWLDENYPDLLRYGPEVFDGGQPPRISQVYGQANSTPKAEYLPLVQDFIKKSGYEVDSVALKNAGMWKHPKTGAYHTKAELIDNPELEDIYASRNIGVDGNWNGNNFAAGGLVAGTSDDDDFSYPGHF